MKHYSKSNYIARETIKIEFIVKTIYCGGSKSNNLRKNLTFDKFCILESLVSICHLLLFLSFPSIICIVIHIFIHIHLLARIQLGIASFPVVTGSLLCLVPKLKMKLQT